MRDLRSLQIVVLRPLWARYRRRLFGINLLLTLSCEQQDARPRAAVHTLEASPNASITPSPLLTGSSLASKLPKPATSTKSAKTAAERDLFAPLPLNQPLPPDEEPNKVSNPVIVSAKLSWPAFPPALRLWGVDADQQAAFINDTQRTVNFTLRPHGRLQISFSGRAFPFDDRSLLQSRYEHIGHILVWPSGGSYRVVPTGSLRSLFNEGRPDATPSVHVEPEPHTAGSILGYPTRSWTFETPQGKLTLQQAEIAETELGAPLVCRFLVELLSIAPTTSACDSQRLPLRAEFEVNKARTVFEVTKVEFAFDGSPANILVPPKESKLRNFGVPMGRGLLGPMELGVLRRGDKNGTLTIHNSTEQLRYLLFDGVPVERLAPRATAELTGVSQGQYLARLVDFWGTDSLARSALILGDTATVGEPLKVDTEPEL